MCTPPYAPDPLRHGSFRAPGCTHPGDRSSILGGNVHDRSRHRTRSPAGAGEHQRRERCDRHRARRSRGLRPDGRRHRRGVRPRGTGREGRRDHRRGPGDRPYPAAQLRDQGGRARQDQRGGAGRHAGAAELHHRSRRVRRPRSGDRGGRGERAGQDGDLPGARPGGDPCGRDPGLQHLLHPAGEAGGRHLPPRPRGRHPLLQPGPGAAAPPPRAPSAVPSCSPRSCSASTPSAPRTAPGSS